MAPDRLSAKRWYGGGELTWAEARSTPHRNLPGSRHQEAIPLHLSSTFTLETGDNVSASISKVMCPRTMQI